MSTTGSTSTPFGYAGEYTDAETGFLYLRARYYDPASQQFLTVDPLLAATAQAYTYAGGSPTNATDPSGLAFKLEGGGGVWRVDDLNIASGCSFGEENLDDAIAMGLQMVPSLGGSLTTIGGGPSKQVNDKVLRELEEQKRAKNRVATPGIPGPSSGWRPPNLGGVPGARAAWASELRAWAKSEGLVEDTTKGVETWVDPITKQWRLKIKLQGAPRPGLQPGSNVPRYSARLGSGQYYDPITGQTGVTVHLSR